MLKKYMLAVLSVAVLLLAACSVSPNVPIGETETVASGTQTEQSSLNTQASEENETSPSMGVGDRGDYAEETTPATEPEESVATTPVATEPVPTEPEETTPETTEPEETTPGESTMTYSQYLAMTEDEQEAFINSFPTLRDFVDWWNAAKAAEGSGGDIITGDPSMDLGDMIP